MVTSEPSMSEKMKFFHTWTNKKDDTDDIMRRGLVAVQVRVGTLTVDVMNKKAYAVDCKVAKLEDRIRMVEEAVLTKACRTGARRAGRHTGNA